MAFGLGRAGGATVRLAVDDAGFNRDLERDSAHFRRATAGMQADIGKVGRGALAGSGAFHGFARSIAFASSAFLGGAGLSFAIKTSIGAASNLAEQMDKTRRVFGEASKEVINFSNNALGLARDQALETASSIGALLRPIGLAEDKSAAFSVKLTKLGVDLSSFYNTSVQDALDAIKSGLVGETEPLRRYGVILSETRVKAEALSMGLGKGAVDMDKVAAANTRVAIAQAKYNAALKEYGPGTTQVASAQLALQTSMNGLKAATAGTTVNLTDQQKVMARINLVIKDSALAHNNYKDTIGGAANQQREFQKNLRNTEILIGQAMLPQVTKLLAKANEWLKQTENQKRVQHAVNTVISTATTVIGALAKIVEAVVPLFRGFAKVVGGTEDAFVLLFALGAAAKLRAIAVALQLVGTSAGTAGGKAGVGGLLSKLRFLKGLGPIAIAITVAYTVVKRGSNFLNDLPGANFVNKYLGGNYLNQKLGFSDKDDDPQYTGPRGGAQTGGSGHGHNAPRPPPRRPPAGAVQIETSYSGASHGTSGLAGYDGHDITTKVGQPILAPEDCTLYRPHLIPYSGLGTAKALGGWTCYLRGHETGNTYFLTHMGSVGRAGHYRRGDKIGTGGRSVNAEHVHVGILRGHGGGSTGGGDTGGGDTGAGSLVVGKGKPKPDKADIPDVPFALQEKLARAELTKGMQDDLQALTEIEAYLVKRIAATKNVQKRIDLLKQLKDIRSQIKAIPVKKLGGAGFVQIGGSGGGGAGAGADKGPEPGKGQQVVNIPGVGKILINVTTKPSVQSVAKIIQELIAKVKAAKARLARFQKALRLELRRKHKKRALIGHLRARIAATQKIISELLTDLGLAYDEFTTLSTEAAEEAAAGEGEGGGDSAPSGEGDHEKNVRDALPFDPQASSQLPLELRSAAAAASLTPTTADDVAVLRQEEALFAGRLAASTNPEERIALSGVLLSTRGALASAATSIGTTDQLAAAKARRTVDAADDVEVVKRLYEIAKARLAEAQVLEEQIALVSQLADLEAQLAAAETARLTDVPAALRLAGVQARGTRTDFADDIAVARAQIALTEARLAEAVNIEDIITLTEKLIGLQDELAAAETRRLLDIPAQLRLAGVYARGTKDDVRDDIAAIQAQLALTRSRLAEAVSIEDIISLTEKMIGLQDELASAETRRLTEIPAAIRLRQAQARLTIGQADDKAVLEEILKLTEARLLEANSIEDQIALTNTLADLKAQLNQLQGQENAELIAYLSARREIARTYGGNLYVPAGGAGSTGITIYNTFSASPPDAHMFSAQIAFDLGALVG